MSDMAEHYRALKAVRRLERAMHGAECPGCKAKFPKRTPTILLPGRRCRVCGTVDTRSYPPQKENTMLDPSTRLDEFSKGQGGGHHQSPTRTLTADGQRVVAWAKTLPQRQNAAVITAFTRMGLNITDSGLSKEQYAQEEAGNGPPRYNFHTGEYFDYGEATTGGVKICTDDSLLVAQHTRPHTKAPS